MLTVAVLLAVWAWLTIDGWYRPQPPPPARRPGWYLAEARRRREIGDRAGEPAHREATAVCSNRQGSPAPTAHRVVASLLMPLGWLPNERPPVLRQVDAVDGQQIVAWADPPPADMAIDRTRWASTGAAA